MDKEANHQNLQLAEAVCAKRLFEELKVEHSLYVVERSPVKVAHVSVSEHLPLAAQQPAGVNLGQGFQYSRHRLKAEVAAV